MHLYSILHFHSDSSYGTMESRDYDEHDLIDPELIDKLFQYRSVLGVTSIKKENKVISWKLNDYWYSSEEIDRILKLKVFT